MEFGDYPTREMMIELSRKSKEERAEDTWFGLYLWEGRKAEVELRLARAIMLSKNYI